MGVFFLPSALNLHTQAQAGQLETCGIACSWRHQQAAQQRQIEEQHQEALRRQQEADREAANRQYQDNEDPEDAVPVLDEKQKEQMYWDAVQRQKVYDKMYSDYERGQREGSES